MIAFWGLILGVPLLAFGGAAIFASAKTSAFVEWFKTSRQVALVLTIVGWYWTAYECHTIGIDVFDMLLKRFPGQLWIMAAVLSYLTFIWMPKNLPVRALTAILMLIPAELFKTTRLLVPDSWGFAPILVFVITAYIGAIIGMYGMFYPWRLEKAMAWFLVPGAECLVPSADGTKHQALSTKHQAPSTLRLRILGAVLALWGAALICIGFSI